MEKGVLGGDHDGMQVKDLMTRTVVTVAPETTLKDVAKLLDDHRIGGMPVCGADGSVLGVVSESDILWKELRSLPDGDGVFNRLLDSAYGDDKRARAETAGDAMSAPAITVEPDIPVSQAARLMLECMINRVPVVRGGHLVGILTRGDLVRAFRRPDDEIEREIRDDLRQGLWLDPDRLSLTVSNGDVAIAGQVENHSTAAAIEKWIQRVPGVADLHSELTWDLDDRSHRITAAAGRLSRKL
jgi:CBS domain-containing protein